VDVQRSCAAMSSADAADAAGVEDVPEGFQKVYVVRCPLGTQCSKKGSILAKKSSEAEARAAVVWHLVQSPYHKLEQFEADCQGVAIDVDITIEETRVIAALDADQGAQWYANRKRARTDSDAIAVKKEPGAGSSSSRFTERRLAVPIGARGGARRAHEETLHVSRIQVQACVDSLRRAHSSAESAGQLCAKAAKAFFSEAACIQNCQDVIETYLND
jgi:hypothetical protein